jgi:drug/metabolite transporter (DMT)-like permease
MATGIAMTALGYSIVFWAATRLPSWTVAVLTATSFLWTYIGECLVLRSERPRLRMFFFLLMGLAGIPLVGGTALQRGHSISSFAAVSVVAGALSWSASSLAIKRIRLPESCWQTAGFQLATAGILLAGVSRALGEWTRVPEMNITLGYQPLLGMTYLIFGGSVIAFGSFHWLMRRESPSLVATFAYANPIVAMALGIGFAGESCSVRQLIGAIAILLSVVLIWKTQPARVSVSMAKDRTDASSGGEARLNGFSETVA